MCYNKGLRDVKLAGPGALSRSIPQAMLKKLLLTEYRNEFLEACYEFDSAPGVCGLGKDTLVASGTVGTTNGLGRQRPVL